MLLRAMDEIDDEAEDRALPEPSGDLTGTDQFPEDAIDEGEERGALLASLPGPLIAAATFVPTFLVVFFGLTYLVGGSAPGPSASTPAAPNRPAASASAPAPSPATPLASEAPRDPFAPPRLLESPAGSLGEPGLDSPAPGFRDSREPGQPGEPREAPRESSVESVTPPPAVVEPRAPASPPALPEAPARATRSREREPRAPSAAPPPRQARTAAPTPEPEPPAAESRKNWTPAAAFTDREAASRLASSIQQQGYPVEIRQDRSSTRPWVVWIGAQPRNGDRRR
jgi:hypothetical protein